ncbi:MAG: 3-isopropylmalate dehydrogenase [Pantoea stewartii]|nr:MAG: 3-isopropylmalate dehydrogenase [Pantoea stewartii]
MPEGIRVMNAAAEKFNIPLQWTWFDYASAEYWQQHGKMLPDDWFAELKTFDAIYFGAVGWPDIVPDHVSLWGSLLQFRREFDQYVNLRPVRLMPGVKAPLANRHPGDIDFYVVRENTEGEYSSVGGTMFPGTEREVVIQETVMTRVGVDRILKFAFDLAQRRPKKHLTSATKSNGIAITMPYWDNRVQAMQAHYPDVKVDKYHIDILTANLFCIPTGLMSWWPAICSAIFCQIWALPVPVPSASRRPPILTRKATSPACLNRYTVPRPISPVKTSRTRLARFGVVR